MSLLAAVGDCANSSLPRHVAIIMDGNGRWAQNRGKMRVYGHKAGVKSVREAVTFAARAKIEALTLFAFSSENWRRPEGEVSALMELFMTVLGREVKKLHSNGIRLKVIGDTARFSERLQAKIAKAEALTANNQGLTLNIAANYGGQWDIAQAARKLARAVASGELAADQIDEAMLGREVCMADLPPVDLLIRTGAIIASAILCYGSSPMPSSILLRCCGLISTRPSSARPLPPLWPVSVVSAARVNRSGN